MDTPRFIRPELPERFFLIDAGGSFGPFDRSAIHHEADEAIVFYEDGSLPMRLGVVEQDGDVLHLFPDGQTRVVPVPPRFLDLRLPDRFRVDVCDERRWVDVGIFDATSLGRLDDGSYVCSGWGGSPLFLRCIEAHDDELVCLDGSGAALAYRIVALP